MLGTVYSVRSAIIRLEKEGVKRGWVGIDKGTSPVLNSLIMAGPTLAERFKYYSAGDARRELGLSKEEFNRRMKQKILPAPTFVNSHGLRFFDANWLHIARAVVDQERQRSQQQ